MRESVDNGFKTIDNINNTLASDLKEIITSGSKLQIAAACFSIYAYQELKAQLESIFSSDNIKYDVVDSYKNLMNIIMK